MLAFILFFPAQDAGLTALRSTLLPLRSRPANDNFETRGATAELTTAKHQLRDWIDSRLETFGQTDDVARLSVEIHDALRTSELFCEDYNTQCHPTALGFVDEVLIDRRREFLVVQTAMGIRCGYDESVYLYRWSGTQWQRFRDDEQNEYVEGKYFPQIIHGVSISAPDARGNRLLLTLGSQSGCAGAFRPIYYRVWQLNSDLQAQLVLDKSELANDGYPPVKGRVLADDVLIEFIVGGTGYGFPHKALRHFEVRDGRATQTDPIAPTPHDFVQEWLSAPWTESATRSESPTLQEWHVKLHREDGMGAFPDPAVRCTTPDIWQVATHVRDAPKDYYRVRWQPPYVFRMMQISSSPYADCTIPDPAGDTHPVIIEDVTD
jgi:hypothetical protein